MTGALSPMLENVADVALSYPPEVHMSVESEAGSTNAYRASKAKVSITSRTISMMMRRGGRRIRGVV